ncbi:MAG: PqqD family protein [Bacteroidota bacterium]
MEVNFFKRKKILQNANTLDLHPVRRSDFEEKEGIITLLMPRFSNARINNLLTKRRGPVIRITLDETGSDAWKRMDGNLTVGEIAKQMRENTDKNLEQAEERLTKYLFHLYQNQFITFKELLKENK